MIKSERTHIAIAGKSKDEHGNGGRKSVRPRRIRCLTQRARSHEMNMSILLEYILCLFGIFSVLSVHRTIMTLCLV